MREGAKENAVRIADAASDMHLASAIVAMCESSLFRTEEGKRFEARMVKLAKEHVQRQYRNYAMHLHFFGGTSHAGGPDGK